MHHPFERIQQSKKSEGQQAQWYLQAKIGCLRTIKKLWGARLTRILEVQIGSMAEEMKCGRAVERPEDP